MTVSISFLKDGRISINSAAPDVIPSDVVPSISPSIDLERIDAIRGYLDGGLVLSEEELMKLNLIKLVLFYYFFLHQFFLLLYKLKLNKLA